MKTLAFALLVTVLGFVNFANAAPVPADDMTCEAAVAYYEKHNRIWVVGASPDDIVPIYGMKPASKWREVRCKGRSKYRVWYMVPTLDDKSCVIAVTCN